MKISNIIYVLSYIAFILLALVSIFGTMLGDGNKGLLDLF